jgi:glycosyltransferase involved in cell wall biosynthesis
MKPWNSMEPLVSVIIPCYNQAAYLPEALNSVYAQTHPHWECIVVNDGSPDHTDAVVQAWLEKDKRFVYIKKENGGLSSARNAGLDAAKGTFIQFLDADDAIHPEKLALQVAALEQCGPLAVSVSDYYLSRADDLQQVFPDWYLTPQFSTDNPLHDLIRDWENKLRIPAHSFLFKSALFAADFIRFDESLPNHEDWDCWVNLFRLNPEVVWVDRTLAVYRVRPDGMGADRTLMTTGFLQAITNQMTLFPKDSAAYLLLSKKYNLVRYGVFASSLWYVYFIRLYAWVKKGVLPIFDIFSAKP